MNARARNAARFPIGRALITPGAQAALDSEGIPVLLVLARHVCGDWGELPVEDLAANELALLAGRRLLSSYALPGGTTLFLKFFGGWIDSDDIVGLSVLTSLAMGVMWIVFAFRAKATLERVVVHQWQITGYRLNPVWTFFFSLFYIVYCLNDLPEAVRRASPIQQPVA